MRNIYLLLAILGFGLPYFFFSRFLTENGLNLPLFVEQLFANDIATFFVVDLIITAVVLLLYTYREAKRLQMPHWWVYGLSTLLVGPSFAFPLFLYFRAPIVKTSK